MPYAQSAPWLSGCPAAPANDTGCRPTHRARTAHPAAQMEQLVKRVAMAPRLGRGIPGQVSLHSAVSLISFQGAGVSRAPMAEPPANIKTSLRVVFTCGNPDNCAPALAPDGIPH